MDGPSRKFRGRPTRERTRYDLAVGKRGETGISAERLDQYDRLIATQSGVERRGATMPYTSVNGHMFSFLSESGSLALRLSHVDRAAFIERYRAELHEAHGIVMKEYVAVQDSLLADTAQIGPYFIASYAYVADLKPKPTRRKADHRSSG